jgi:diaminopimelate decarboxylase
MFDQPQSRGWADALDGAGLRTPAFVYCVAEVERRIRALKTALGGPVIISFKAIANHDVIARLSEDCWDGIELASKGELHRLAGLKARHHYVNTPALSEPLARAAIAAGAAFIVDQPEHLDLLARVRGRRELRPVTLRLSNRLIRALRPEAPALRPDQFGMDLKTALAACDRAKALGIAVNGLHLYAGPHTFARAGLHVASVMAELVPQFEARLGHRLSVVNLGGGLEENWEARGHDFAAYRAAVAALPPHLEVLHEFGRAIFATAGAFAVTVLSVKTVDGQPYAVCDGGMAQAFLLAGTEAVMRRPRTPRLANRVAEHGPETILVGSTCSRDDAIGRIEARLAPGDVLIFDDCGAYVRSYSPNNFLLLGEAESHVL